MTMRHAIALATLALVTTAASATADDAPQPTGRAEILSNLVTSFGIDQFDKVDAIRFTFNVQMRDRRVARSWLWRPKTNEVLRVSTLDPNDDRVEYDRDELNDQTPESIREVDAKFINDTFWLLLPWHLQQADDVSIESTGLHVAPLGKTIARRIIVRYPADGGGYTPGDMYKLYVDDAWRIVQWTFHRAGAEDPSLACIWTTDKQVGPLLLTTEFRNREADFYLWFTGLAVQLVGSDDWHEAKQVDHGCRNCP